MSITYLKKSPKTSSTDDSKTTGIVQDLLKDIDKTKISELLAEAEENSKNSDITDQNKYLVDQKIDVLRTLN